MRERLKGLGTLEVIAFVSGFVLMVFELASARVLAPSIGSSTYVWTSVIGVIIAALSLGYFTGGLIADRRNRSIDVARLCLAIGVAIVVSLMIYGAILLWAVQSFEDPRIQGVVASLLLFAPTSFLLGALSPYLVKLNVTSLKTSGSSVASLSALNSLGGIVGTFIAGFILFGYMGARETFAILAIMMVILSWLVASRVQWRPRLVISFIVVFATISAAEPTRDQEIDTPSAHYSVFEKMYNGERMRGIAVGPTATQSGVYINNPDKLAFWYTQQMARAIAARADKPTRILMLGGGTFTLPQYLAMQYPAATIDVVEIDPELATIARDYFYYKDPSNVNLIFDDARTYMNQSDQTYDAIIVDVYGGSHVPFSFMTREYGERVNALLRPNGVAIANIIAGMKDECSELFAALDAPYRRHLPYVQYMAQEESEAFTNMVVTYGRAASPWPGSKELRLTTKHLYTDNYAPAERLQQDCLIKKQRA